VRCVRSIMQIGTVGARKNDWGWSEMGGTSFLRIESRSFRGLREVPPKLAVSMVWRADVCVCVYVNTIQIGTVGARKNDGGVRGVCAEHHTDRHRGSAEERLGVE